MATKPLPEGLRLTPAWAMLLFVFFTTLGGIIVNIKNNVQTIETKVAVMDSKLQEMRDDVSYIRSVVQPSIRVDSLLRQSAFRRRP